MAFPQRPSPMETSSSSNRTSPKKPKGFVRSDSMSSTSRKMSGDAVPMGIDAVLDLTVVGNAFINRFAQLTVASTGGGVMPMDLTNPAEHGWTPEYEQSMTDAFNKLESEANSLKKMLISGPSSERRSSGSGAAASGTSTASTAASTLPRAQATQLVETLSSSTSSLRNTFDRMTLGHQALTTLAMDIAGPSASPTNALTVIDATARAVTQSLEGAFLDRMEKQVHEVNRTLQQESDLERSMVDGSLLRQERRLLRRMLASEKKRSRQYKQHWNRERVRRNQLLNLERLSLLDKHGFIVNKEFRPQRTTLDRSDVVVTARAATMWPNFHQSRWEGLSNEQKERLMCGWNPDRGRTPAWATWATFCPVCNTAVGPEGGYQPGTCFPSCIYHVGCIQRLLLSRQTIDCLTCQNPFNVRLFQHFQLTHILEEHAQARKEPMDIDFRQFNAKENACRAAHVAAFKRLVQARRHMSDENFGKFLNKCCDTISKMAAETEAFPGLRDHPDWLEDCIRNIRQICNATGQEDLPIMPTMINLMGWEGHPTWPPQFYQPILRGPPPTQWAADDYSDDYNFDYRDGRPALTQQRRRNPPMNNRLASAPRSRKAQNSRLSLQQNRAVGFNIRPQPQPGVSSSGDSSGPHAHSSSSSGGQVRTGYNPPRQPSQRPANQPAAQQSSSGHSGQGPKSSSSSNSLRAQTPESSAGSSGTQFSPAPDKEEDGEQEVTKPFHPPVGPAPIPFE